MLKLLIKVLGIWLLLNLTLGCQQSSKEDPSARPTLKSQLDGQIPGWMESYRVPGVSIAVITNGEIGWSAAYGFADQAIQTPMKTETVCRVESISKSVTARGVMKLVEKGSIKLDDPIIKHLNSWQFPPSDIDTQSITIRQLLSHSSGLSLGSLGLEYAPKEDRPALRESLSKEVNLTQKPGSSFNYSNVGYHLLELLIEDVSGQTFSEYMQEEVLAPLNMLNAGFQWSEDFITQVPNGHDLDGRPVPVYVYSEKAAGGLFANVEDIARFVSNGMVDQYYSEENILSEQGIRALYTPMIEVAGVYGFVSENYGLGHFIETLPDGKQAVFGGGQGHGWMTHFHMVPETGDGIVILTNSSRSWPLIANILSEWTDRNSFGFVGMELITQAGTAFLIVNALMLVFCLWMTLRILFDLQKGWRSMSFRFSEFKLIQYVYLFLFVILISVLIWIQAQDYLFVTSIFPGVGEWFILILWFLAFVFIISVLFPRSEKVFQSR